MYPDNWPSALRERLGHTASSALADVLNDHGNQILATAAERFEHRLAEECGKVRTEMQQLAKDLRADFKIELATLRADVIKWSFLFWVGQAVFISGVIRFMR